MLNAIFLEEANGMIVELHRLVADIYPETTVQSNS
jgi:hypothetical protein